jgi:hypothetical protein
MSAAGACTSSAAERRPFVDEDHCVIANVRSFAIASVVLLLAACGTATAPAQTHRSPSLVAHETVAAASDMNQRPAAEPVHRPTTTALDQGRRALAPAAGLPGSSRPVPGSTAETASCGVPASPTGLRKVCGD